jgi:choline-glycine betaine transporter
MPKNGLPIPAPVKTSGGGGLFPIALPICALVALGGILDPEGMASGAGAILSAVFRALDWFFMTVVTAILVLTLWLALSKYGRIKLGGPDDEPEFSYPSWLAMLFAAGMGVGLLFWGVAEPLLHFSGAPGEQPGTPECSDRHTLSLVSACLGRVLYGSVGPSVFWLSKRDSLFARGSTSIRVIW